MKPIILGLAASHNGAACVLRGNELQLAIQEERLVRKKRAPLNPENFAALQYVLGDQLPDLVALCPLHDAPAAAARLAANPRLAKIPSLVVSHHRAHAMAALAQSGFETATILVLDGAGSLTRDLPEDERALIDAGERGDGRETASIYRAEKGRLTPLYKQIAPRLEPKWREGMMPFTSLGVMYQSVAQQIFGQWDAAGKVMALASLGVPRRAVSEFLDGDRYVDVRGEERWPQRAEEYAALAAETQRALEAGVLAMVERARRLGGSDRLGYAGGVALNSVANTRIINESGFGECFIMPAAEDNGTAIGAAYLGLLHLGGKLPSEGIAEDATGREYSREEMMNAARGLSISEPKDLFAESARLLDQGHTIGWFQGRSELGPRALGQRSILMDPRIGDGKDRLNRQKGRESFRPFAPAILAERAGEWFENAHSSPYMLQVWRFRPERAALVPAVVHSDGTGRVQTVKTGRFRQLIEAFEKRSGIPLVLNTSFNYAGEPIVETPSDAVQTFLKAQLDVLIMGDFVIGKPPPK